MNEAKALTRNPNRFDDSFADDQARAQEGMAEVDVDQLLRLLQTPIPRPVD